MERNNLSSGNRYSINTSKVNTTKYYQNQLYQTSKKCKAQERNVIASCLRLERSVFLKNLENNFFQIFLFLLKRSFQGILSCLKFLLELPKFKENFIIFVITVVKERDLLITHLEVITRLATVSEMNEYRSFILICTSYMILLVIFLAKLSSLFSICRV